MRCFLTSSKKSMLKLNAPFLVDGAFMLMNESNIEVTTYE